jgi:beta-mannosidase
VLLRARLVAGKDTLAEDRLYFRPVKDLVLPSPQIETVMSTLSGGGLGLALGTSALVKNLYLRFDDQDAVFSDNYFDLLPGKTHIVEIKPAGKMPSLKNLKMVHMAQIKA